MPKKPVDMKTFKKPVAVSARPGPNRHRFLDRQKETKIEQIALNKVNIMMPLNDSIDPPEQTSMLPKQLHKFSKKSLVSKTYRDLNRLGEVTINASKTSIRTGSELPRESPSNYQLKHDHSSFLSKESTMIHTPGAGRESLIKNPSNNSFGSYGTISPPVLFLC